MANAATYNKMKRRYFPPLLHHCDLEHWTCLGITQVVTDVAHHGRTPQGSEAHHRRRQAPLPPAPPHGRRCHRHRHRPERPGRRDAAPAAVALECEIRRGAAHSRRGCRRSAPTRAPRRVARAASASAAPAPAAPPPPRCRWRSRCAWSGGTRSTRRRRRG